MTRTIHLIVGPKQHGVPRHGELIASALGHDVVRAGSPDEVDPELLRGADVIHLPYTDRVFARSCEDSATIFRTLVDPMIERGQAVSVTLHDLPGDDSPLETRRRAAYRQVVAAARGVVVNSHLELFRLDRLDAGTALAAGKSVSQTRSRRRIPLPVIVETSAELPPDGPPGSEVVVLGFVFPDRGYEHTIAELPEGMALLALGGPAVGHEALPAELAALARSADRSMTTTGFVPDHDLAARLAAAGVPVAPNRRVAASGSISTWIGHGRRPLVPDTPYSQELSRDWPDTLTIYDADQPGSLRQAIEWARADPARTRLDPAVLRGPRLAEVAAAYADHFEAMAPDEAMAIGQGRWIVPGNRWDLLDGREPVELPRVSVVIPYFKAQNQLDRVLAALAAQHYPLERVQVVVADDGSPESPTLDRAGGLTTVLVRQDDRGFRAAAARNLGTSAADGEIVLFLDQDTIPEPDYVRHLVRLPTLLPDALTVGRRRHTDFRVHPPVELNEPGWLVEAYRSSGDLLTVDQRSYRFVISAVMALHRDLFGELGGFNEEFTSYGGEDWEFAHRAYVAGAVFAHVPDAVAWHDGPDWAGRVAANNEPVFKNAEALALARLLPDPVARGGGQWMPYPAAVLRLHTDDPAAVLATARSAFGSGADCGIWLDDSVLADSFGDGRIAGGPIPDEVLARATVRADLAASDLSELPELVAQTIRTGRLRIPAGVFTSSRAERRARRWAATTPTADLVTALFGQRDLAGPKSYETVDLAHELKQTHQHARSRQNLGHDSGA